MGKDPAFLFYSSDFITGVSDLTMEERGQYITLLCLHHQKGRLTKKIINLSVPNVSDDVMAKFSQDKNGFYFNKRLEMEAEKRRKNSNKQKERALKGWAKRRAKNSAPADAPAMPLENENENRNENGLLRENTKTSKKEMINEVKTDNENMEVDRDKGEYQIKFRKTGKTKPINFEFRGLKMVKKKRYSDYLHR